jgi:GAF domain-containing protein
MSSARSSARGSDHLVLVRGLVGLMLSESTMKATLDRAAALIAGAFDEADDVSVTLADGRPLTIASSGELALRADEGQYDVDTGPCLHAMRSGEVVVVDDLTTEKRWPQFQPHGVAAGVRSSLSLPLRSADEIVGSLNIYSRTPGSFDADSQSLAEEIASYTGVVLMNAELYFAASARADQMREAMESRAVIEQAKGILMAQQGCDADTAFFLLVRRSQTSHQKLRVVAAALVEEMTRA